MLCKCCVLSICSSVHMSMPLMHSSCSWAPISCLATNAVCYTALTPTRTVATTRVP